MKLRAPKNGYNFKEKVKYRETVWKTLSKNVKNIQNKKILMFPAYDGDEIYVALKYGVQPKNIYACDENAGIIATAPWRKEFPEIQVFGTKLERTIERMGDMGIKIDVANFDFCSNLCKSVLDDLDNFVSKIATPDFYFALTMLKGREPAVENMLAKMIFKEINGTADRFKIACHYILNDKLYKDKLYLTILKQSQYNSGNRKMSFGVANIKNYYQTQKEWYHKNKEKNKEKIKKRSKEYRSKNKEEINKKQREYVAKNREKINKQQREYWEKNKEKRQKYYKKNKEEINKKQREYAAKNREKINKLKRERRAKNKLKNK